MNEGKALEGASRAVHSEDKDVNKVVTFLFFVFLKQHISSCEMMSTHFSLWHILGMYILSPNS